MPVVVAQITAAESKMLSTACCSIFRASAKSDRASSRSCFRSPGFGAVRRYLPASRKRLIACLTSLRASFTSRMLLHEQIERVLAQLRQHAGRMAQPDRPLAEFQQLLEDVIDRQVARGAGQHLPPAADRLANHLDDGRRLAGAGRAVDQAHVAGGKGELHGIDLRLVERAVQGADGRIDAEFRLPHAQQHVAEDGAAVAAEHAGLFQRGPLPLRGHLVEGRVEPPDIVVAQLVGQAVEGDGDRGLAPLANDAAIGKLGAVFVRRKDHRAADVRAASRAGARRADGSGGLLRRSSTIYRPPRPAFSSATTRSIRLLPVFSASAGDSRRTCCAARWASSRLSRSKQPQEPAEMVFRSCRPRACPRAIGHDPRPHAAIAEHLPVDRLQQAGFPAVGHLDDRRRPAEFDPAHPPPIESADAVEKVENFRLGRAAGQGFDVQRMAWSRDCRWRGGQRNWSAGDSSPLRGLWPPSKAAKRPKAAMNRRTPKPLDTAVARRRN